MKKLITPAEHLKDVIKCMKRGDFDTKWIIDCKSKLKYPNSKFHYAVRVFNVGFNIDMDFNDGIIPDENLNEINAIFAIMDKESSDKVFKYVADYIKHNAADFIKPILELAIKEAEKVLDDMLKNPENHLSDNLSEVNYDDIRRVYRYLQDEEGLPIEFGDDFYAYGYDLKKIMEVIDKIRHSNKYNEIKYRFRIYDGICLIKNKKGGKENE